MQLALTPTIAADIQRNVISEGVVAISISGEIVEGDGESLIANVKAAEAKGYTISEIRLNSIGGNGRDHGGEDNPPGGDPHRCLIWRYLRIRLLSRVRGRFDQIRSIGGTYWRSCGL